jgi:hypothetical protein
MAGQLDSPKFRQARAEEARVLAGSFEDGLTRDMMLRVADGYERLAEHAENRLGRGSFGMSSASYSLEEQSAH